MSVTQIRETKFLTILWDEKTRIIAIDWKETTGAMTDDQFKMELTMFASHVEELKARGILVDVSRFHHKMAPQVQQWRVKNISNRYNGAGVKRFAFLFPTGADVPSMTNQSSSGEDFLTEAFTTRDEALAWLQG